MERRKKNRNKTGLILSAILLFVSFIVLASPEECSGEGLERSASVIRRLDREQQPSLRIYSGHAEEAVPFQAENLFPGDSVRKTYTVAVSHKGEVDLFFETRVHKGYEKLAEVLKCRITVLGDRKPLFEGLLKDAGSAVPKRLPANTENLSEITYIIEAYLDTSVGNDYMQKKLVADLRWYVMDEEAEALKPPKTGDLTVLWPWIALMSIFACAIILLFIVRKKGV